MVRWAFVCVLVVVGGWLGAVQLASSAAYGDLAAQPSLPALLHEVNPRLWRPLVGDARARAAAAVHDGDLPEAERLLAGLPGDAESADLRGRLAQARGDRNAALADYVRAGDVVRAQRLIDALAIGDRVRALGEQQKLVAVLLNDPNAAEVTGEAWWRLGQLQAAEGYRHRPHDRGHGRIGRAKYWREAEESYERALALAPNEETYLLAAAYQSLANGDIVKAQRFYARAAAVVPNSADAFAGLAWTAAAARECAAARTSLVRARTLRGAAPNSGGARDPVDDPLVGPALRRCLT